MSGHSDITVLIPIHRERCNRDWLEQALSSFPEETPHLILENTGNVAGALNKGLRQASTEFVLPFGSDDIAGPGFLDFLLGPAWNADVVYPSMLIVNEDLSEQLGYHPADPFCGNRLLEMNYITGAALIRREKAIAAGGYRRLQVLEDWDLWVRMHRAGAHFKPCLEAQLLYRQHDGSRNAQVAGKLDLLDKHRKRIVLGRLRRRRDPLEKVQATFYNAATPATTYLRCQLPARHLPAIVRPHVMVAMNEEEYRFPEQHGKTAVFQLAADKERALMALMLREKGIRVLVESDDHYLAHPGQEILKRSQWSMQIGEAANTREGHRSIVREADGVIVATPYLADRYREINPNVYVCPNTVDPADWPEPVKPADGVLRIVWTASASHKDDIPLVTRAFEWASRQEGVEVYAVGLNPGWRFPHGHLPWLDDLDAYRHTFHHFDIGVAPIKTTPFALGRSDVKALEYGMGLVAPVLSDVAPYKDWAAGETCLKASDAKGFLRAIQHLVANRDEVRQLAEAARSYALAERTTAAQIHHWQEALDG